jgi:hypothetical protein
MRRSLTVVALILLISIPLAIILRGFTREVLLSILVHLSWLAGLYINSIPQPILWVAFVLVVFVVAARSLIKRRSTPETKTEVERLRTGRVHNLMRAIHRTSQGIYFKWRLAQRLLSLTLEVLAHQERTTPLQMKERLKSGRLGAPPEIEAYLLTGLTPVLSRRTNLITRMKQIFAPTRPISPLELDPERVVRFIEDQMENEYDQ